MSKPIGEVELKGKSIDEHLETEEGRGLLRWLIDQTIKEDNFKGWTLGRNKYIKERLDLHKTDPEATEKNLKEHDGSGGEARTEEVPEQTVASLVQAIIIILERIEANQRKLLTKEGIVWD